VTAWRWAEHFFATLAIAMLGYCGLAWLDSRVYQAYRSWELNRHLRRAPGNPVGAPPRPASGSLIGRLAIPRLGVSAMVLEGVDRDALRRGVGHLSGTALPGQAGNVVLAGHRDTFFRPLRDIREDDRITLVTPYGSHHYLVEWRGVVQPEDTRMLQHSQGPMLTLVTCFPFHFVGPAPEQFVVRARRLPDEG
jgi:sortase A